MGARHYIEAEAARTPSGTPVEQMAHNTILTIPREELPAILHELMCHAIRGWLPSRPGHHRADMTLAPARPQLAAVPRTAKPGKSKWEVGLPAWRQLLNRSQLIDGKAYRLGDLTADMLRQAATCRRKAATTMVRNAEWYEKVAAALEEHGKAKVADLPDDVLAPLVEAVAA